MKKSRYNHISVLCKSSNVIDRYIGGESAYSIAKSIGVKSDTVKRFLYKNGIKLRSFTEAIDISNNMGTKKGAKRPCIEKPLWSRRTTKKGYVFIKSPKGWIQEHRLVMEIFLSRSLSDDEVVHHIDGDTRNNSFENLKLMTISDHTKLHCAGSKRTEEQKLKISKKAKERLSNEMNHPYYKHITIDMIDNALGKGITVKEACKMLGICKRTFYNKINKFRKDG